MVFDPIRGTVGGVPIAVIQQAQFQQAQREAAQRAAARKAAFEAAATAMRATGAVCDMRYMDASGTDQACRVPAAGRCSVCSRAFCLSHRSSDVSDISGLPGQQFYAAIDLCAECQRKHIAEAVRAAENRAREAKVKRQLEAQAEAALRAEKERQDREHAERVAAHELQTNWAATQQHIEALKARIARVPERGNVRPAVAWISIPTIFFAILLTIISVAPSSGLNDASPIAFVYFIIAAILCYGVWALVKRARRSIRTRKIEELRTLAKSRDKGCGEAECQRCYQSF